MKILIVEKPSIKNVRYNIFVKIILTMFSILPTLYVRRIAALTPKKHKVTIVNDRYTQIDLNKHYDLVNIHFNTASASIAYKLADLFRKRNITVVLSGLHASALPEEAKKHADSIILGRGESNWLTLLNDLEKNNLKPFYYPEKIDPLSIKIPPTNVILPGFMVTGAVEATRGCPHKCCFCPESNTPDGNIFYTRPVNEVIDEIKKIPQKTIMFYDASLTISPTYTKKLFKEMIGLKKKFFCNGNVDVLAENEELVRLSKKAGCIAWLVGFESISQESIENIGKTTNKVIFYKNAIRNIHKYKMAVIGSFMFGFDNETIDVFNNTLKVIKELKIDAVDFSVLTPFPGTPLFYKFENDGRILTKEWINYDLHTVVFNPKNMSPKDLINGINLMCKEFYSLQNTLIRIFNGLRLGIYPFMLIIARNIIAYIISRQFQFKN